ncbi:GGDEF domain-containing protein [Acidaminobacter sp. JC074]|uniref:GGDEF domain-containing protein n=1 Tax=Acidaminobacter sp. JC074 TaxID=2530199 RepID=UPI001F0D252F|nr:GGDEF domain-containing protein [Acidaminobacter sp. JC074]
MRKIMMLFMILIMICTSSYAEETSVIEDYLEIIESRQLTQEDLDDYQKNYGDNKDYEALGLFLQARLDLYSFEYEAAYNNLQAALKLTNDDRLLLELHYYLAEMDREFYKIPSSLDHANKAKVLAEALNDHKRMADMDYIIAFIFADTYNDDDALSFSEKSLDLSERINYDFGIAKAYLFMSNMKYYEDDFEGVLEYTRLAKEALGDTYVNNVMSDVRLLVKFYEVDAQIALDQIGDAEEALLVFIQSLDSQDKFNISYMYQYLGSYFYDIDKDKSIDYYLKSLDYYNQSSLIANGYNFASDINLELGLLSYDTGQYKKAAEYMYESILGYNDASDEDYSQLFQQLDEYKLEDVNEQIKLLEEVNLLKEKEITLSKRLLLISIISIGLLLTGTTVLIYEIRSKQKVEKELYINSITDDLTKAFNRGKIIDLIENNMSEENGLILLDIDDFKVINDTHGHAVGDVVLVKISDVIRESIRDNDFLGRYGGEEFIIFLKDVRQSELSEIAERVRKSIENIKWDRDIKTTASIGVTKCFSMDFDEVFHKVDNLMYQAKASGKNKVVNRVD